MQVILTQVSRFILSMLVFERCHLGSEEERQCHGLLRRHLFEFIGIQCDGLAPGSSLSGDIVWATD